MRTLIVLLLLLTSLFTQTKVPDTVIFTNGVQLTG